MKTNACDREPEVLGAVLSGQLSDELRAHAAACDTCGEVARVAALVHDDFIAAKRHAPVPTADVVWLRAQIRAREEAARTAARPIVFTQALAVAALLGLLVSLVGKLSLGSWTWPTLTEIPLQLLVPLGIVVVSWLVFAPVALYLAFSRD